MTFTPTLISDEIVGRNADAGGDGAGWGSHLIPFTITADGTRWTVNTTNGTPSDTDSTLPGITKPWQLYRKRPADAEYALVATGEREYKEKPLLFTDGDEDILLIGWSQNGPKEWSSWTGQITPIPGDWYLGTRYTGTWAYAFGTKLSGGRIMAGRCCVTDDPMSPNVPGIIQWAIRGADDTWSPVYTAELPARITYLFVFELDDGSVVAVGTRDATWNELHLVDPHTVGPAAGYCFNQIVMLRWPALTVTPTVSVLREEAPTEANPTVYYTAFDAMLDQVGRLHVLGGGYGPSSGGAWFGDHLIVDPATGVVLKRTLHPIIFPNRCRLIQDGAGRFALFSVYMGYLYIAQGTDTDTDGTDLQTYPGSDGVGRPWMRIAFPGAYSQDSGHHYIASRRSGAALDPNVVEGVAAQSYIWQAYALRLAAIPTPDEPPVDDGSYAAGYGVGHQLGYTEGFAAGVASVPPCPGDRYAEGKAAGVIEGRAAGHAEGFDAGRIDGERVGRVAARNALVAALDAVLTGS